MKLKKLTTLLIGAVVALGVVGCSSSNTVEESDATSPETVMIKTLNGNKEEVDLEVPFDPQRIAILDLASLDIIDSLGKGDRVVGSAETKIEYLKSYSENAEIKNLGTIKEADLEAVMECEPDVIFIGGRLAESYDELSEIAPVVYLETNTEIGLVESIKNNATTIASMFGLESEIETKMAQFTDRIKALSEVAEGKNALVGMTTSGGFNLLGNDGRCSIIGKEIGFENLTKESASEGKGEGKGNTSSHGNESSFETIVKMNPNYIFVMDRDSAIGTEGAQSAKEIMENELVKGTEAYKNGNIVYMANPNVWYTAEGGIKALDIMLADLESGLGIK